MRSLDFLARLFDKAPDTSTFAISPMTRAKVREILAQHEGKKAS